MTLLMLLYSVKMVLDIKDLKVGQKLEGVVRNVVDFGAFVDIGIHEDGLIRYFSYESQIYQTSQPSGVCWRFGNGLG